MDMTEILNKMRTINEEAQCNMTAEGEECPVHGMEECWSMEEEAPVDEDKSEVSETLQIALDGEDAYRFIDRMMQLSGQTEMSPTAAHIDIPQLPAPEAVPHDMDVPAMATSDEHYVCDDCGHYLDNCSCEAEMTDDTCVYCGHSGDECTCDKSDCGCGGVCGCGDSHDDSHGDMSTSYQGVLDSAMEEGDYGHEEPSSTGKPVKLNTYEPDVQPERITKGNHGSNPFAIPTHQVSEAALFAKLKDDYLAFIAESENEDGVASPLTATDREEFDKDPNSNTEPNTTGEFSPMTNIKRQDVKR